MPAAGSPRRSTPSAALEAHAFDWDVRREDGTRLAPGVYVARLDHPGDTATLRFVVTK